MRSIAEKFGCSKSQVQSILAKEDEILEHYGANKNARCKRDRLSQLKNVDLATYKCYQKARSKNIPVTGLMLQEKTKRANEELGGNIQSVYWMARQIQEKVQYNKQSDQWRSRRH